MIAVSQRGAPERASSVSRSAVRGPTPGHADFEEFYAAHFYGLTLQINAYVNNLTEAQDLVQEAFTRAVARWDKLARYDDPATWVRRVAWNLATSRWRRQRTANAFLARQRVQHAPGPNPDRVALTAALATLPPHERGTDVSDFDLDALLAGAVDDYNQQTLPQIRPVGSGQARHGNAPQAGTHGDDERDSTCRRRRTGRGVRGD